MAEVHVRPLSSGDYASWRDGFAGRRPARDVHDEGPVPPGELTPRDFEGCLERYARWASEDRTYVLGAFPAGSDTLIGLADLSTLARDDRDWANLGFRVHNQHHGRGLGSALIRTTVAYGFETLRYHRIEAAIRLDNPRAIRAAEAAGLERECIRRRFWKDPDGWTDHVVYVAIAGSR